MQPLSAPPRLIAPKRGVDTYVAVDPAPSVLSYRMQRLWLTPIFRAFVRVGLPAVSIVGLVWIGPRGTGQRAKPTGAPIANLDH